MTTAVERYVVALRASPDRYVRADWWWDAYHEAREAKLRRGGLTAEGDRYWQGLLDRG